jgi:hypothetical protein
MDEFEAVLNKYDVAMSEIVLWDWDGVKHDALEKAAYALAKMPPKGTLQLVEKIQRFLDFAYIDKNHKFNLLMDGLVNIDIKQVSGNMEGAFDLTDDDLESEPVSAFYDGIMSDIATWLIKHKQTVH